MAHRYVIGGSGSGKSTLMLQQIIESIDAGHGVCFIDPHGTDTDTLLPYINRSDLVLFDPMNEPVKWNPLREPLDPALAATTFAETIKDAWGYHDMTTPVMDMYLYFIAAILIENGHHLRNAVSLLYDPKYRSTLHKHDPVLQLFWDEYEALPNRDRRMEAASTGNKLFTLLADPRIRDIFATNRKGLRLSDIAEGQVFIVRLPIYHFGQAKVSLLGSLIIAYLNQVLLVRNRPDPFDLYVDEVQLFASGTLQSILSGSRKFGLNLTVAHQYIAQLDRDLFDSLMGNTSERFVFKLSEVDARYFHPRYGLNGPVNVDDFEPHRYRRYPWHNTDRDRWTVPLEI